MANLAQKMLLPPLPDFDPAMSTISRILSQIHARHRDCLEGKLADYIPELTKADPNWFGIAVVTTDGYRYAIGDSSQLFTIQSISKAFTYGIALDLHGPDHVLSKIGVEPSGEAFNEISLETGTGRPFNPMINAGAIAATGMIPGTSAGERFEFLRQWYSAFAGRDLGVDESVYRSESATGFRNRAIAYLLRNSGIIDDPVEDMVEAYFMQCSVLVNCFDLATMAACLANGGVNPITQSRVMGAENVAKVLSVMGTCGMYDATGEWIFRVGLPAKSGVGGGILGVLPGQMGLAVFSPLLDPKGNSVRGLKTFHEMSEAFNLHLFNIPALSGQSIRNVYQLSTIDSHRQRPKEQRDIIRRYGDRVTAIEMQGDLFFASTERALRVAEKIHPRAETVILDLLRVGNANVASQKLLREAAINLREERKQLYIVDPKELIDRPAFEGLAQFFTRIEAAMERAERQLLEEHAGKSASIEALTAFHEFEIFAGLAPEELTKIEKVLEMQSYQPGEKIVSQGSDPDYIYLLAKGSVGVFAQTETGPKRLAAFSPGVSFGDLAIVNNTKRTADVISETASRCYQISAEEFNGWEKSDPAMHARIIKNLLRINVALLRRSSQELASLSEPAKWRETPE